MVLRVDPGLCAQPAKLFHWAAPHVFTLFPTSAYRCWRWWESPSLSYLHGPPNDAIFTRAQTVGDLQLSEGPPGTSFQSVLYAFSFILPMGVVGCTAKPLTVWPLGVLKQLVSSNVRLFRLSGCMRTNNRSVWSQLAHFPPIRMCHLSLHPDLLLTKLGSAWDFSHSPLSVIQSK